MKKITIAVFATILVSSCSKDCTKGSTASTCSETVPSGELCTAYFQRWFYNSQSNSCQMQSYSGCSQKGFATQQECEACRCK